MYRILGGCRGWYEKWPLYDVAAAGGRTRPQLSPAPGHTSQVTGRLLTP